MSKNAPMLKLDDFIDLLDQLDRFIDAHEPQTHLTIKAIGGFSLMYHEQETSLALLRKGSSDIDTLTMLPRSVATMVDIIATNNGINSDWLNNTWYANHDFKDELEPYIVWEDTEYRFKHITLKVADIEGIFLMKARAVCDALEFVGYPEQIDGLHGELRTQDVMDVIAILRFFEKSGFGDIRTRPLRAEILGFDRLIAYLEDNGILA